MNTLDAYSTMPTALLRHILVPGFAIAIAHTPLLIRYILRYFPMEQEGLNKTTMAAPMETR